jgi:iron complex outermembrane receptor protein
MNHRLWAKASVFALAAGVCLPQMAAAQGAVEALRDEVLVVGTKKASAENVQDVPLAVSAYGEAQLDALKVRDLGNLSYSMPNVGLEDIGTSRGIANFAIRGLGVNSSIPSIDPAVGTFVDGVYLGQNAGVVLDIFDLASVEVLRGPQGILFGRNVTGGAVLINTKRPNLNEWEASFKTAIESGFRGTGANYYLMGSVSGPIIEDRVAIKLAAYYNNDDGWQSNYLGGPNLPAIAMASPLAALAGLIAVARPDETANHGAAETWIVRPSILIALSDSAELVVRYEHFDSFGDGPSAQNHPGFLAGFVTAGGVRVPPIPFANFLFSAPKDSFTFSIDEPGFYDTTADAVTAELNIDVGFGDGKITNIFGWRSSHGETFSDIDGTPFFLFHAGAVNDYEQISNEIRYAGRFFDALETQVGFYYFEADHVYQEERYILGNFRRLFGGGLQDSRNYGVFGQLGLDITDRFQLIGGVRYTNERKHATLSNITLGVLPAPMTCSVFEAPACTVHFEETRTWKNVTPKAGFQWDAMDNLNVYGHWTQGVRSGGYNFRNTSVVFPIAHFDEEKVDAFEVGFKAQPGDGAAVINAAFFVNKVNGMQREINLPDAVAGVVQLIRNTADATIFGFEIETRVEITDNLMFLGNIGHLDGDYNEVLFNLNSDFVDTNGNGSQQAGEPDIIDDFDLALQIPRLAPWTYSAGLVHSYELGNFAEVSTRFNWSHRDDNAYTDNNLGILRGADILDASMALDFGGATLSFYGQNLLNEVTHGGETQLPTSIGGGTFAPLNKGRVIGVELQFGL